MNVNRYSEKILLDNVGMSIGSRIREIRKLRNLSQTDLAKRVGMKPPSISELESGKSAGSTKLAAIAQVLGVNALWLETGKGKPDLSHVEPVEIEKKFSPELEEIIKIMDSLDHRGQIKVLFAAQDAATSHLAWLNSLPKPAEENHLDIDRREAAIAMEKINEIESSASVGRRIDAMAQGQLAKGKTR